MQLKSTLSASQWRAFTRALQSSTDASAARARALQRELDRRVGNEALLLSFIAPSQRAAARRLLARPTHPQSISDGRDVGYMCKTDYEWELGCAAGGVVVHPSLSDLTKRRSCVAECGIVQVRVSLKSVVRESDYSHLVPDASKDKTDPRA